VPCH